MKSSVNFAPRPSITLLFCTKFFILFAYISGKMAPVFFSILDTMLESAITSTFCILKLYVSNVLASEGLFKFNKVTNNRV